MCSKEKKVKMIQNPLMCTKPFDATEVAFQCSREINENLTVPTGFTRILTPLLFYYLN